MKRCLIFMAFLCALVAGCRATSLPPLNRSALTLERDEEELWRQADKEAESYESGRQLFNDRQLDAYLDGIARRLLPPERQGRAVLRVRVVRNPYLNAFSLPNGRFYIHTGLLAAVDNEAQLATVMAHEISHVINRDALRIMRELKNKAALFGTLSVLTGNYAYPLGALGTIAAVSGYSREVESEADTEGLRMLVEAGYDPSEAPEAIRHLQREAGEEKWTEPYFFGSHPHLEERLRNFETLVQTLYADRRRGVRNEESFRQAVAGAIFENSQLDLRGGRYGRAREELERYLAIKGDIPLALFLIGETYRQEGGAGNLAKAQKQYQRALEIDPAYPEPYRALGFIAYKLNDAVNARQSLERYLQLAPQAPDRNYVEDMLRKLRQGG